MCETFDLSGSYRESAVVKQYADAAPAGRTKGLSRVGHVDSERQGDLGLAQTLACSRLSAENAKASATSSMVLVSESGLLLYRTLP